jgi:hypothetical protein
LAQRAEIDRQLALLKQGKQVAKQRRQAKLAPTPAGADEYWKTHALPTDRIKPATKSLEETEAELAEDLKKWFKEKWVRFGPDGKIRGDCARGSSKEGKPKCLPQSKAHALGKKGRASSAAKKRREDPNPERRGPARNVATKVKEQGVAETLSDKTVKKLQGLFKQAKAGKLKSSGNFTKGDHWTGPDKDDPSYTKNFGHGYPDSPENRRYDREITKSLKKDELDEKQDACYRKVKSRYKVWPSAYASGALVQCRKKGAANWGTGAKKK